LGIETILRKLMVLGKVFTVNKVPFFIGWVPQRGVVIKAQSQEKEYYQY
jgi:hypothetical protein